MTVVNPHLGIPMTAEQYATHWQENAQFFSDGGHYQWMADYLGNPSSVIEIGCGSGSGTLALAKKSKKVISIEVNITLANTAAAYLNGCGVSTQVAGIDSVKDMFSKSNCHQVTIVVVDVFDNRITEALPAEEFDAIVCWLIGANPGLIAGHVGKSLESFTGQEMPEYREKVHKRCYELGRSLLKVGGIVHITDRIALTNWNEKDNARLALMEHHHDLSEGKYEISKGSTFLKRLEKSFATSKIQYITAPEAHNCAVTVLSSITAQKR